MLLVVNLLCFPYSAPNLECITIGLIPRIGRVVGFRYGTFFCFISMIHSVGE